MPLYEYQCRECGKCWETLMVRASDPAPSCPGCGGRQASRLLSSFAVTRAATRSTTGPCGSTSCACDSGKEL